MPPPVVEVLPETELTIESTTALDTDNVSPFPKSKFDKEPDAAKDAMLDVTAAVRLCAVVPAAPVVEDGDDDKDVVGVVVDGFVIRDPPPLGSCATEAPTFRPRDETPELLALLVAWPPPPPDDPELTRLSMNGDASALGANPRTAHARITKKARALKGTVCVRFAIIIS